MGVAYLNYRLWPKAAGRPELQSFSAECRAHEPQTGDPQSQYRSSLAELRMDNKIGSVEVGKYGDPATLDRNSLEIDFKEIADIKCEVYYLTLIVSYLRLILDIS